MSSDIDGEIEAPALFDSGKLGATPQTARGERTRSALIASARRVFERDGFVDSRLVDIVAEANCSIGSFYTWFEGKDEVFAAVLCEAQSDMLHPGTGRISETDDPVAIIAASNRAYFEAYRRNARLNDLLQQVAAVDPRFRALRIARSRAFVTRNARAIADLQSRGLADRRVDAAMAAKALSGMISRLAYDTYVIDVDEDGRPPSATDRLVETATRMWTNALGLTSPELRGD
ncbi:TetR/AcrR family transcriptional regulator [Gordonia sp. PP30]|uniref:TetR/AcrR family transcriptional regulator n=1 Tax=unclassified Gordonia (in: high G+C Gram-positive bacteria) TaxID=2657482 RepID=UPI001FFF73CA|nr:MULTISPECIES: TetR/AcrR family transcriptional regulator [unclassified Gordonia (in: high G+C Gram-positive bacteria)]UQE74846.1 TetR/AcrR family transcriptional regulator [Gordonia sp. PP30]